MNDATNRMVTQRKDRDTQTDTDSQRDTQTDGQKERHIKQWTIPFKSERYAISLIGFRVHAGVRKITSYVMFIQEFICRI